MSKVIHKVFSGFTACCTKWISQSSNVLYSYNVKKVTCKRCLAKLKKEKSMSVKSDTIISCPCCGEEWASSGYVYFSDYDKLESENSILNANNKELADQRFDLMAQVTTLKAKLEKAVDQRNKAIDDFTNSTEAEKEMFKKEDDKELDSIE